MVERQGPSDTVITSMLIKQSDGRMSHDVEKYFASFRLLLDTGMPIVLYLEPALVGSVEAPNLTVIPTSIADLDLWRETRGIELQIPTYRNPVKDTADYLIVVNAKTELVRRTIELGLPYRQHAFIDFGVFHFISRPERAQQRIRQLDAFPADRVVLPGCLPAGSDLLDGVNWRFSGAFFYGPTDAMAEFAMVHQATVRANLPKLSWEVNMWALMETRGSWSGRWYFGDHNDSIFDYPEFTPFGE